MPYAFQINLENSQSNLFYLWSDKHIVQEEKIYTFDVSTKKFEFNKLVYKSGIIEYGDLSTTLAVSISNLNIPLGIFGRNKNNTIQTFSSYDMYLKYFKIYDGDNLIRDYIPVLDLKGIACLYDKVEKKFYYNEGS